MTKKVNLFSKLSALLNINIGSTTETAWWCRSVVWSRYFIPKITHHGRNKPLEDWDVCKMFSSESFSRFLNFPWFKKKSKIETLSQVKPTGRMNQPLKKIIIYFCNLFMFFGDGSSSHDSCFLLSFSDPNRVSMRCPVNEIYLVDDRENCKKCDIATTNVNSPSIWRLNFPRKTNQRVIFFTAASCQYFKALELIWSKFAWNNIALLYSKFNYIS